jgi:MoxR-like ATPase
MLRRTAERIMWTLGLWPDDHPPRSIPRLESTALESLDPAEHTAMVEAQLAATRRELASANRANYLLGQRCVDAEMKAAVLLAERDQTDAQIRDLDEALDHCVADRNRIRSLLDTFTTGGR